MNSHCHCSETEGRQYYVPPSEGVLISHITLRNTECLGPNRLYSDSSHILLLSNLRAFYGQYSKLTL